MTYTIRLPLGANNPVEPLAVVEDVALEDSYFTTLKDVAIIMHALAGHGVTMNLARELSNRFHLKYDEILAGLDDIFSCYYVMSDETAYKLAYE